MKSALLLQEEHIDQLRRLLGEEKKRRVDRLHQLQVSWIRLTIDEAVLSEGTIRLTTVFVQLTKPNGAAIA